MKFIWCAEIFWADPKRKFRTGFIYIGFEHLRTLGLCVPSRFLLSSIPFGYPESAASYEITL
jgi:hypothetical protein